MDATCQSRGVGDGWAENDVEISLPCQMLQRTRLERPGSDSHGPKYWANEEI